jgi:hypothetical protein
MMIIFYDAIRISRSPSMTEDEQAVILDVGGCVVPGRGGGGEEVVVPADGGEFNYAC